MVSTKVAGIDQCCSFLHQPLRPLFHKLLRVYLAHQQIPCCTHINLQHSIWPYAHSFLSDMKLFQLLDF